MTSMEIWRKMTDQPKTLEDMRDLKELSKYMADEIRGLVTMYGVDGINWQAMMKGYISDVASA